MSQSIVSVAALQMDLSGDLNTNLQKTEHFVRKAAAEGAHIILPPELFEGTYFCKEEKEAFFRRAQPVSKHPSVLLMQKLAADLKVWIPVSFFERTDNHFYNSMAMVDATGSVQGLYRKSHIPDGPGYEEKFYFRPGNTGFKVWETPYGKIGVGICWDQWFPECARAMALQGADILFYPTAIGSEPEEPELDTRKMWQRVMVGHAVANVVPVVASNRIGNESGQLFYGHSFIADQEGEIKIALNSTEEDVIVHEFDLEKIQLARATMGFFRDRRPDLYGDIVKE